jgi:hypothetical protein
MSRNSMSRARGRDRALRLIRRVPAALATILGRDRRRQIDAVIDYFGESREARFSPWSLRVLGAGPGREPGPTHRDAVRGRPRRFRVNSWT